MYLGSYLLQAVPCSRSSSLKIVFSCDRREETSSESGMHPDLVLGFVGRDERGRTDARRDGSHEVRDGTVHREWTGTRTEVVSAAIA